MKIVIEIVFLGIFTMWKQREGIVITSIDCKYDYSLDRGWQDKYWLTMLKIAWGMVITSFDNEHGNGLIEGIFVLPSHGFVISQSTCLALFGWRATCTKAFIVLGMREAVLYRDAALRDCGYKYPPRPTHWTVPHRRKLFCIVTLLFEVVDMGIVTPSHTIHLTDLHQDASLVLDVLDYTVFGWDSMDEFLLTS